MELSSLNALLCLVVGGLDFVFGTMKSTDDSELISIKIKRKLKVIFASLNSLDKTEEFILIYIKTFPKLIDLIDLCFRIPIRNSIDDIDRFLIIENLCLFWRSCMLFNICDDRLF
jgi:hypothetical protein